MATSAHVGKETRKNI